MSWTDGFSPTLLDVLSTIGGIQTFRDGECMIQLGDCETHLFHIVSGEVSVATQPASTRLKTGDLLGEMAFLDNRPRIASAFAVGLVEARRIERQDLFQALSSQPLDMAVFVGALAELQKSRLEFDEKTRLTEPRAFVEELAEIALSHRAVSHPYLVDLASGNLPNPRWALTDFARHYHGYSSHFPRYLTALISRLVEAKHRAALLENLMEEAGQYSDEDLALLQRMGIESEWIVGVPHPSLFQRFRMALGMEQEAGEDEHIEVICWREMFLSVLTHGSPAEAVGALGLGTENIVRSLYGPLVQAIESAAHIPPRDAVFFPLHTAVDDHHQAALANIASDLAKTPENRSDLSIGMHKALALRAEFWSWLHKRALDPGAHENV